jgi:hypothetical protein
MPDARIEVVYPKNYPFTNDVRNASSSSSSGLPSSSTLSSATAFMEHQASSSSSSMMMHFEVSPPRFSIYGTVNSGELLILWRGCPLN